MLDSKSTSFGISIVLADGERELRFSKPPTELAPSLFVVFSYEISSQIVATSRIFTVKGLSNDA
jgi:hypothetical protein